MMRGAGEMTRRERMLLPGGMAFLFCGLMLKRFGGDSYPVIALQLLMFGASIFLNIRYMLKLRAERSRTGGDG
jgi:hypothetical protein